MICMTTIHEVSWVGHPDIGYITSQSLRSRNTIEGIDVSIENIQIMILRILFDAPLITE